MTLDEALHHLDVLAQVFDRMAAMPPQDPAEWSSAARHLRTVHLDIVQSAIDAHRWWVHRVRQIDDALRPLGLALTAELATHLARCESALDQWDAYLQEQASPTR